MTKRKALHILMQSPLYYFGTLKQRLDMLLVFMGARKATKHKYFEGVTI